MSSEEVQAVVIDNGSYSCKAGLSGDEQPRKVIPSNVDNRGSPINRGFIQDWDDMEKLWGNIFRKELGVDPAEHPVLLTDPLYNPSASREKMIQIMFEKFNVPSFYVAEQPLLSIFSTGRTNGIVCEIGHEITQVASILEDYLIPHEVNICRHASTKYALAGSNLNEYLDRLMLELGYLYDGRSSKLDYNEIKEKHCYVALDYNEELYKARSRECDVSYRLPDGHFVNIASERFRCPELLFKPFIDGLNFDGIHEHIFKAINKVDVDQRGIFYANIVLSGGTSMFDGLPERINKEIENLAPPTMKVKVVAAPERKYAAWIGGSIFASLATFPQKVITHDDYNDSGPSIVHRKCF